MGYGYRIPLFGYVCVRVCDLALGRVLEKC